MALVSFQSQKTELARNPAIFQVSLLVKWQSQDAKLDPSTIDMPPSQSEGPCLQGTLAKGVSGSSVRQCPPLPSRRMFTAVSLRKAEQEESK